MDRTLKIQQEDDDNEELTFRTYSFIAKHPRCGRFLTTGIIYELFTTTELNLTYQFFFFFSYFVVKLSYSNSSRRSKVYSLLWTLNEKYRVQYTDRDTSMKQKSSLGVQMEYFIYV